MLLNIQKTLTIVILLLDTTSIAGFLFSIFVNKICSFVEKCPPLQGPGLSRIHNIRYDRPSLDESGLWYPLGTNLSFYCHNRFSYLRGPHYALCSGTDGGLWDPSQRWIPSDCISNYQGGE